MERSLVPLSGRVMTGNATSRISGFKSFARFCCLGLLVAGLEEFITQGVLKRTYAGWILPTLIAFLPFLVIVRIAWTLLDRLLPEPASILGHYMIGGTLGLMVEWFLIGLSPWRDPQAPILALLGFQAGMFSFWGSVALIPRILLDTRASVSRSRRLVLRFAGTGGILVYILTFTIPERARFWTVILAVLTVFLSLNFAYFQYLKALRKTGLPDASSH